MSSLIAPSSFDLHTKDSKSWVLGKCKYAIEQIEALQARINATSDPANYSSAVSCAIATLETGIENATELVALVDHLMTENGA